MNDYDNITEWPRHSDAARKQRQAMLAREQEELPGKAMAIVILVGLIMVFVGAAYRASLHASLASPNACAREGEQPAKPIVDKNQNTGGYVRVGSSA